MTWGFLLARLTTPRRGVWDAGCQKCKGQALCINSHHLLADDKKQSLPSAAIEIK